MIKSLKVWTLGDRVDVITIFTPTQRRKDRTGGTLAVSVYGLLLRWELLSIVVDEYLSAIED